MNGLNAYERQNLHDQSRRDDSTERGRDRQASRDTGGRGIDRVYLNVYVPACNTNAGSIDSFAIIAVNRCHVRPLMNPMTRSFVAALEDFAA